MEQSTKYDYIIIDPASTEFNRGSFCYLPYILYNAISSQGYEVLLLEDFTLANIDNLPQADNILIALWSYPQIEACLVLNRFLEGNFKFFGYYPLIDNYNFPKYIVSDNDILSGMMNYPKFYDHFKTLLLSDCDMHLKKYEGIVYPLFTSYGCPRNCEFCPSSVNCDRTRIEIPIDNVKSMLEECRAKGILNIHFTDEDFFYNINRAKDILTFADGKGFNFIALGSVSKVQSFIDKFGENILEDAGVRIIEVGFETADPELAKSMKKPLVSAYEKLSKSCTKVDIFWLTLTFFPGETITTLNETGDFLREHGFTIDQVYGRIATNGTEGGLGQFFQYYHGVRNYDNIMTQGVIKTSRPMRLLPSFIPYSFLESGITAHRKITDEDRKWFKLYKIDPDKYLLQCDKIKNLTNDTDGYIFYAICARLKVIV